MVAIPTKELIRTQWIENEIRDAADVDGEGAIMRTVVQVMVMLILKVA